jgi:HemY protein
VAVAAGDSGQAGRLAKRAAALLDEPPLTLLLGAQAAQLAGEEGAAKRSFEAMLEHKETEFLGLRGLLAQARREGDSEAALSLARRARDLRPEAPWVLDTLFDLESAAGNWGPAEEALGQATRLKLVAPEEGRRRRALVLMGRAGKAGDDGAALEAALGALKAAPELVPATALAARLLAASGKDKRAEKLLREGWRAHPHPDLLAAYQAVHESATAEERLAGFRKLSAERAGEPESRLALAGLALAAGRGDEARAELDKLGAVADARAYRLMAALEEQAGNGEAARAALARAAAAPPGPAWLCRACGRLSAEWLPRCANCGGFDDLEWTAREGTGDAALPVPMRAPPADDAASAGQERVDSPEVAEEAAAPPVAAPRVPPPPDVPAAPGHDPRPAPESSG